MSALRYDTLKFVYDIRTQSYKDFYRKFYAMLILKHSDWQLNIFNQSEYLINLRSVKFTLKIFIQLRPDQNLGITFLPPHKVRQKSFGLPVFELILSNSNQIPPMHI